MAQAVSAISKTMEGMKIEGRAPDHTTFKRAIDSAIEWVCVQTGSKHVNFFDKATLEDLKRAPGRRRYIIATEAYAFGEWEHGEDVHWVTMSDNTEDNVLAVLQEGLDMKIRPASNQHIELSDINYSRKADGDHNGLMRFVKLSSKDQAGCRFYLHYCKLPGESTLQQIIQPTSISGYDLRKAIHAQSTLPPSSSTYANSVFALVRDTKYLASDPDLFIGSKQTPQSSPPKFEIDQYRRLRRWAKSNGLWGPELGFLGSKSITWVLYGALSSPTIGSMKGFGDECLKPIFEHFKTLFRWNGDNITDLEIHTATNRLVSTNISPTARKSIWNAINKAVEIPVDESRSFIDEYDYFISIRCKASEANLSIKMFGELQKAIRDQVKIVVDCLNKYGGDIELDTASIRVWPFIHQTKSGSTTMDEYHVIAIRRCPECGSRCETLKNYIANTIIAEAKNRSIAHDQTKMSIQIDVSKAEDFEQILQEEIRGERTPHTYATPSLRSPSVRTGFRPAHQAISRLRHDSRHQGVAYDLGYEDRHAGLVWMSLEHWGNKPTENEDFIPEHRVRVLRRTEDGWVVWDREARVDRTDL